MNAATQYRSLAVQEKSILLTLLYFDIFHYPLTEKEILKFLPSVLTGSLCESLSALTQQKCIFELNGFYSLRQDPALISRRCAGNSLAEDKMRTAQKFSALIAGFPFVRSVMLSGSISKGYMDASSDIDYFIITEKGRLWLVRTAMALFRRVFLFNSRKYFCTNYFIDCEHLEIEEKNIFTAIETSTLKPMFGRKYVYRFQAANQWYHQFLPNHQHENGLGDESESFIKRVSEKLLSSKVFDSLEQWLRSKFVNHWRKNYQHALTGKDFSIAFESTEHVSRSHPGFYQKR
ncbi:MAG TPA: hypothetical protein VG737_12755, partial [Cyclobacteriaceae bacterium]|nr:hypothetical protein [Cyclobacteriaceae bacterium]